MTGCDGAGGCVVAFWWFQILELTQGLLGLEGSVCMCVRVCLFYDNVNDNFSYYRLLKVDNIQKKSHNSKLVAIQGWGMG